MTCIVGLVTRGKVLLGGDSACTTDDGEQWLCREPKVWTAGCIACGAAGEEPFTHALRWDFDWPDPRSDLDRWAHVDLVRAMMVLRPVAGEGSQALIGIRGQLWGVQVFAGEDGSEGTIEIRRPLESHAAIGSGGPAAWSALEGMKGLKLSPQAMLSRALEIASACRSDVRRPWTWASA